MCVSLMYYWKKIRKWHLGKLTKFMILVEKQTPLKKLKTIVRQGVERVNGVINQTGTCIAN